MPPQLQDIAKVLMASAKPMQELGQGIDTMTGAPGAAPVTPAAIGSIGSGAAGPPALPGMAPLGLPGSPEEAPGPAPAAPPQGSPMASAVQAQGLQPGMFMFSNRNKWLKNLSVASAIMQDVGNVVTQIKQKKWEGTMKQSSGFMGRYIGLTQALQQPNLDPTAKAALEEQRQQMIQDPKFIKAWDKAQTDPNSPEYAGFSKAQQNARNEATANLAMEHIKAQIAQAQAAAAASQAASQASKAETAQREALTPKTPEERDVALQMKPTAGQKLEAETEIKKARETTARTTASQEAIAKRQLAHDERLAKMQMYHDDRMAKKLQNDLAAKEAMQKRMVDYRARVHGLEPTADIKTRQQFSKQTLPQIPKLRAMIDDLEKQGKLGPAAGRWEDFWVKKGGFDDPAYNKLRAGMSLFATGLARAHLGGRSGINAIKYFNDIFGVEKMSPDNIRAALDAAEEKLYDYAKPLPGQPGYEGRVDGMDNTPPAGAKIRDFTDVR